MGADDVFNLIVIESASMFIYSIGIIACFCKHGRMLKSPTRDPMLSVLLFQLLGVASMIYLQYGVIYNDDFELDRDTEYGYRQIQLNIFFFS